MRRTIKANHRCSAPEWHVAVDVETRPAPRGEGHNGTVHLLWFGHACRFRLVGKDVTRRERFRFGSARAFWDWLYQGLPERKLTWLWAHKAGYDLAALEVGAEIAGGRCAPAYRYREKPDPQGDEDERAEPEGLLCMSDPPTILDLQSAAGRRFVCVDLMNFLPTSLKEVGDSVGLEKVTDPGDESDEAYWERRCEVDVEIVVRAVAKLRAWQLDNDLGNLRYTASGQSLALWRHRCMDCEITWGHSADVKRLERASYYPGMLRAHYLGPAVGPVYRLDVNSCYPHVMAGRDYPVRYCGSYAGITLAQATAYLAVHEAVALVSLTDRDRPWPARCKGQVSWRVGTLRTALAGPDLRDALGRGVVKAVHLMHCYQRGRPFDNFVKAVLALRHEAESRGDRVWAKLSKNLANSLHGKFGQWAMRWRMDRSYLPCALWGVEFDHDGDTGEVKVYRSIGGHAQRQLPRAEREDSFPLIAAYVSSYARQHVREAVAVAGAGEVYYQDVDSIHTSQLGYDRMEGAGLLCQHQAGRWKVESRCGSAQWFGPKNYVMDGKRTCAGLSPKAYLDARGLTLQTNFYRLDTLLNGEPPAGPVTEEVQWVEPIPRLEGRIGEGGWLAYPVELG